jgi:IS1 family transposase
MLNIILVMNKLSSEARAKILSMLVEGMSMRAVSRIADVSINTVTKLLIEAGSAAEAFHDLTVRNVRVQQLQCDEIWAFCKAKRNTVLRADKLIHEGGDVWTFTALDSDSKLMVSWFSGDRDRRCMDLFLKDAAKRVVGPVQISTDGYQGYKEAISEAFGWDASLGQVQKVFASTADKGPSKKYSPGVIVAQSKEVIFGTPNRDKISTSHVERQNLNIRMGNRRFTRLTNGFSKKLENHSHSLAVYFFHYNFCRIHKSLKVTPAMQAGVTDELMDMTHLVRLIDMMEEPPKPRGPYKKSGGK